MNSYYDESQSLKDKPWLSVGRLVEAFDGENWHTAEWLKYHNGEHAVFFTRSRALAWVDDIRPILDTEIKQRTPPEGMALVPREITAESGHKAGMIGDFSEAVFIRCTECNGGWPHDWSCEICHGAGEYVLSVDISWTTIKAIHKRIVEIAEDEMTQDNGMDVSPSWQELKNERDALVAHVKRLRELCDYWIMAGQPGPAPSKGEYEIWLALGYHSNAWTEHPTSSLARLKAEWQAQALEDFADDMMVDVTAHKALARAAKLRRQAEGGE